MEFFEARESQASEDINFFALQQEVLQAGHPDIQEVLQAEHPGVAPIAELLVTPHFPYATGDFEWPRGQTMSRDEYINYGRWVVTILDALPPEQTIHLHLRAEHLKRMHTLGLGPRYDLIASELGKISEIRRAIGVNPGDTINQYDDWSQADYVAYAAKLAQEVRRRPTRRDYTERYQAGEGPSYAAIARYAGGIRTLHELIGYPDITSWEDDNYIDWGIEVLRANGGLDGEDLTSPILATLSKLKRGPSVSQIAKRFLSIATFQDLVTERLETNRMDRERTQKQWAAAYDKFVLSGALTPANRPSDQPMLDYDKAVHAMRYRLAALSIREAKREVYDAIAKSNDPISTAIRARKNAATVAEIETTAAGLGIYAWLWPPQIIKEYRAPEAEVAKERARTSGNESARRKYRAIQRSKA